MNTCSGEPGKQRPDGGHVLFDGWGRGLGLDCFDIGRYRDGVNVFKVSDVTRLMIMELLAEPVGNNGVYSFNRDAYLIVIRHAH
jgi:hypothetical protein